MGGKAALLVVIGFSLIFVVLGNNFNSVSTDAVDNFYDYYDETKARNIAISGANIAANEIFMDQNWGEGYSNIDFEGGILNVYVSNPYYSPPGGGGKVTICHIPPGNPAAAHEITISSNAVPAHLAHGDKLGGCGVSEDTEMITIVSEGIFNGVTKTVNVELRPSSFARFAYFSNSEGGNIWWTTRDTVWGPFHTNDYLRVNDEPVFYGKASSNKKLKKYDKYADPKFYGGYETGISIPIPTNGVDEIQTAAQAGGFEITGHDTVYMKFVNDTLKYRFNYNDPDSIAEISSLAPNGVIFADNATIRLEGTVDAKLTVGVSGSEQTYTYWKNGRLRTGTRLVGGDIYIDNDIVYKDDPTHGTSDDLLGLVAQSDIIITDNIPNRSDINIHAAMYCEEGGFGAENHSGRPNSGFINLLGGITQNTRAAVGTFSGSSITSGFSKRYYYDDRLLLDFPPFFPGTGRYEVVSWYE